MVLHPAGCGRVTRRRKHSWWGFPWSRRSGKPHLFYCLLRFPSCLPLPVMFCHGSVFHFFIVCFVCFLFGLGSSDRRSFPCGVPGRGPAGFREEDSFPVCSAWAAPVPVCPCLPFAGCSVPGNRGSPIRPAGVPSPLIPMSPESFAGSSSGSPCFVHCFTDRIVELDYTGSETIQNELVSLIGLCIGGYHHVRWVS